MPFYNVDEKTKQVANLKKTLSKFDKNSKDLLQYPHHEQQALTGSKKQALQKLTAENIIIQNFLSHGLRFLIKNNQDGSLDDMIAMIVKNKNFKISRELLDLADEHLSTVRNYSSKSLMHYLYNKQQAKSHAKNEEQRIGIGQLKSPFDNFQVEKVTLSVAGGGVQYYEALQGYYYTKAQVKKAQAKQKEKKPEIGGAQQKENELEIGGAQQKEPGSGKYRDHQGTVHFIKSSALYPADNIAEVITADLMIGLVKDTVAPDTYQDTVTAYSFIWNKDLQTPFVGSAVHPDYKGSVKKHAVAAGAKFINSEPAFYQPDSKKILQAQFKTPQMKKDICRILAACLLLGDYDCQADNLFIYMDKKGNLRVGSYDHGWGMVDLFDPKHLKIKLFDIKAALKLTGVRGTHKKGGLPTNHFRDYDPDIIKSREFVTALREIAANSKVEMNTKIAAALAKIDNAYSINNIPNAAEREVQLKKAYTNLALHLSGKISLREVGFPENRSSSDMKAFIQYKLDSVIATRTNSMLLTASLLEMRLNRKELKQNAEYSVAALSNDPAKKAQVTTIIEQSLVNTLKVIQDGFFANKLSRKVDAFMPNEAEDKQLTDQITKMLDFAKARDITLDPKLVTVCHKLTETGKIRYENGKRVITGASINAYELEDAIAAAKITQNSQLENQSANTGSEEPGIFISQTTPANDARRQTLDSSHASQQFAASNTSPQSSHSSSLHSQRFDAVNRATAGIPSHSSPRAATGILGYSHSHLSGATPMSTSAKGPTLDMQQLAESICNVGMGIPSPMQQVPGNSSSPMPQPLKFKVGANHKITLLLGPEERIRINPTKNNDSTVIQEIPNAITEKSKNSLRTDENIYLIIQSLKKIGDPYPSIMSGSPDKAIKLYIALANEPGFLGVKMSEAVQKNIEQYFATRPGHSDKQAFDSAVQHFNSAQLARTAGIDPGLANQREQDNDPQYRGPN